MTAVDAPSAGDLAERIAAAAAGCDGVVRLSAAEATVTYRRGLPLRGVAVHGDEIAVGVVVTLDRPVTETADAVAAAVAPLAGDRPVHVIVGDVVAGEGGEDDA
ncbi:hypothetical protein [Spirillospora sp. NPDC047279]|uniref:hypothetical protein n=1 Tax=Spirillospora sp. NPDC047279 TaxID=3155478 RepID=UPI0033D8EC2A